MRSRKQAYTDTRPVMRKTMCENIPRLIIPPVAGSANLASSPTPATRPWSLPNGASPQPNEACSNLTFEQNLTRSSRPRTFKLPSCLGFHGSAPTMRAAQPQAASAGRGHRQQMPLTPEAEAAPPRCRACVLRRSSAGGAMSAPALMHSWAICRCIGASVSCSWQPMARPAWRASRSMRPSAITARSASAAASCSPVGVDRACR